MRALATSTTSPATGTTESDATRSVIDAVRAALTALDGYEVSEMTDDVEVAELVGRLRSLAGILVAVIDR